MIEAEENEIEASAPLLEKIIKENEIEGLAFDLDNTLFYTNEHFHQYQDACSIDLAERFQSSIPSEEFVQRMAYNLKLEYFLSGCRPDHIEKKYQNALDMYFKDNYPSNYREYKDFVRKAFAGFYLEPPKIIEGSEKVLKFAIDKNIPFVFNSNAQPVATKIKVGAFEELLGIRGIPYNAVNIDKIKDWVSWKNSVERINVPIERVLAIGDSLETDVLAAIAAGCRNIVWVKGDLTKLPLEVRENPNIHIWCIKSVEDLV